MSFKRGEYMGSGILHAKAQSESGKGSCLYLELG